MTLQVLLALDNLLLRKLITALLEMEGHQVTTRDCGLRTLRTLQERQFDLILIDLNITGAELEHLIGVAKESQPQATLSLLCDDCRPAWAAGLRCLNKNLDRAELANLLRVAASKDQSETSYEESDVA